MTASTIEKIPGGDQSQLLRIYLSFPGRYLSPTGEPSPLDLAPEHLSFQIAFQTGPTVDRRTILCIIHKFLSEKAKEP